MMKRYCLRLSQKVFDQLRVQAESQGIKVSEYSRRLIELGLQVDQYSKAQSAKEVDAHELKNRPKGQSYWQHQLSWTLENRFLLRLLVETSLESQGKPVQQILQESKRHAESYVHNLIKNKQD